LSCADATPIEPSDSAAIVIATAAILFFDDIFMSSRLTCLSLTPRQPLPVPNRFMLRKIAIEPENNPRWKDSYVSINSIVRFFGAPVIEPIGNVAFKIS
jgi:hypothetical protein